MTQIPDFPTVPFEAEPVLRQAQNGATVACLCSSDKVYGALAAEAARALKEAGAATIYAGRPDEGEATLKSAGIDAFLYQGIDAVAVLQRLHADLGVGP